MIISTTDSDGRRRMWDNATDVEYPKQDIEPKIPIDVEHDLTGDEWGGFFVYWVDVNTGERHQLVAINPVYVMNDQGKTIQKVQKPPPKNGV